MKTKKQNGFSMLELMISLAIVSILAAVAIPQFQQLNDRAVQAEGLQIVYTIASNNLGYFAAHNHYGSLADMGLQSMSTVGGGGVTFSGIVNGTSGNIIEAMVVGRFKIHHVDWTPAGDGSWAEAVTIANREDQAPTINTVMTGAYMKKDGSYIRFQVPFGLL